MTSDSDNDPANVDLRALRYFKIVGRTGNIGRAARELGLSQPAVSGQMQKLEAQFGTSLFMRHPKGVTLTAAGARLMRRIDSVMAMLESPLLTESETAAPTGALSVALPPEIAPVLAPRLVALCSVRWPRLSLTIREGQSAALEEWLLEGSASVAILQDPPSFGGLKIWPVATETLGLVTNVRSDVAPPDQLLGIRDLTGAHLIMPGWRHWVRRTLEAEAFKRGARFGHVRESESINATKSMVRTGLGWAVLPFVSVQDDVARGTLTYWPLERGHLVTVHAISMRAVDEQMPFIPEICEALLTATRDVIREGVWGRAVDVSCDPPMFAAKNRERPSARPEDAGRPVIE